MNDDLIEALDRALEGLQDQESLADLLGQHKPQARELEPLLKTAVHLEVLRPVVSPAAGAHQADRRRFLAAVEASQAQNTNPGLISGLLSWFHTKVFQGAPDPFSQKERRAMSALMLKVILILSVLFSLGGRDSCSGR